MAGRRKRAFAALDLLSLNDVPGCHAPSWYAASAPPFPARPRLDGRLRADAVVVGAGYTGLSAALHLAEAGRRVVCLDAQRVGWGASGRNGGQLVTGQCLDQVDLEATLGRARAHALFQLAEAAKTLVHTLRRRFDVACDWRPGYLYATRRRRGVAELRRTVDHLRRDYAYPHVRFVAQPELSALVASPALLAALVDDGGGHLHPLAFAHGLARAAEKAGARLFELSRVAAVVPSPTGVRVTTAHGEIDADHVMLAGNAYLSGLAPSLEARIMPVNSFVAATEPLGPDGARALLPSDACVADDRFVVSYFRRTTDHRLLFGGGETYRFRYPTDPAALVRRPLENTFPQLRGVRLDYAWGGTLAITRSRLPIFQRVAPRVVAAGGYSGQGLALAVLAGKLMAEAVAGESDGFDTFAALPHQPFPGGTMLRRPLLSLAMGWFALRDRLAR